MMRGEKESRCRIWGREWAKDNIGEEEKEKDGVDDGERQVYIERKGIKQSWTLHLVKSRPQTYFQLLFLSLQINICTFPAWSSLFYTMILIFLLLLERVLEIVTSI